MDHLEIDLPRQQNRDYKLLALVFINLITNASQQYVLPFYPPLAFHKAGVEYSIIGMLMSVKSIGALVAAYLFGTKIQYLGRKRFLLIALMGQSMIMFQYASLYFMTDYYLTFLGNSILIRILEGVMKSIQSVVAMTYLNIFYSSTFGQKFSLMESMASLGQMIGPVIGSLLNYYLGYWIPLVCFGFMHWGLCIFVQRVIPGDEQLSVAAEKQKKQLPLCLSLGYRSVLVVFMALVVSRATVIYFNSFFSNHMASYDINENLSALMISIPQVSYTIIILICSRIFTNRSHYRIIFSISLLVNSLGASILSPIWNDIGDIHHIWIGLVLIALGGALSRLPSIPVLTKALGENFRQNNQELVDMASALLQMTLSVSNLLFPTIGGILYEIFGGQSKDVNVEMQAFRLTMLTLVVMQILMFGCDLALNGGLDVWGSSFLFRRSGRKDEKSIISSLWVDNLRVSDEQTQEVQTEL